MSRLWRWLQMPEHVGGYPSPPATNELPRVSPGPTPGGPTSPLAITISQAERDHIDQLLIRSYHRHIAAHHIEVWQRQDGRP